MSTITTKQLRENMSQVINDLKLGNSIHLSYRHKVIGVLQPVDAPSQALQRGSPEAIRQGLQSLRSIVVPNSVQHDPRSVKKQISELRSRKYSE
jgi:antitoxin (DNA-binding transcriptional repressor) of toxin-antitoxin stability system